MKLPVITSPGNSRPSPFQALSTEQKGLSLWMCLSLVEHKSSWGTVLLLTLSPYAPDKTRLALPLSLQETDTMNQEVFYRHW